MNYDMTSVPWPTLQYIVRVFVWGSGLNIKWIGIWTACVLNLNSWQHLWLTLLWRKRQCLKIWSMHVLQLEKKSQTELFPISFETSWDSSNSSIWCTLSVCCLLFATAFCSFALVKSCILMIVVLSPSWLFQNQSGVVGTDVSFIEAQTWFKSQGSHAHFNSYTKPYTEDTGDYLSIWAWSNWFW